MDLTRERRIAVANGELAARADYTRRYGDIAVTIRERDGFRDRVSVEGTVFNEFGAAKPPRETRVRKPTA